MDTVRYCHSILFGLVLSGLALSASANTCECTEVIGDCSAHISVTPTGSSKGQYGADLEFTANAPACAKVEYQVDNTPQFTILPDGKHGEDRVMGVGMKPFTSKHLTYESCKVCKTADQVAADRARAEAEKARAEQAEVDRLVGAAVSNGSLEPSTYGAQSSSDSSDALMNTAMQLQQQQLQQQLQQQQLQQRLQQQQMQQQQAAQQRQMQAAQQKSVDPCAFHGTGWYMSSSGECRTELAPMGH